MATIGISEVDQGSDLSGPLLETYTAGHVDELFLERYHDVMGASHTQPGDQRRVIQRDTALTQSIGDHRQIGPEFAGNSGHTPDHRAWQTELVAQPALGGQPATASGFTTGIQLTDQHHTDRVNHPLSEFHSPDRINEFTIIEPDRIRHDTREHASHINQPSRHITQTN